MANTVVTTSAGAASKTAFGFVKVGDNIDVTGGVISVTPSAIPVASATVLGGVKPTTGLTVDAQGTLTVNESWLKAFIQNAVKNILSTGTVDANGVLTFSIDLVTQQPTK